MTTRIELRVSRAVVVMVATLGLFGTAAGRVGASDTAAIQPASGTQHLPTALAAAPPSSGSAEFSTDDPPSDSTSQSTTPSDTTPESTTPESTTPDDSVPAAPGTSSDDTTNPVRLTLALIGFAILLAIAASWMVRHQGPDDQPYPRPVDDAGEFPDGML
jgi:hypothetical protein